MEKERIAVQPVSYTHLDVYKRQVMAKSTAIFHKAFGFNHIASPSFPFTKLVYRSFSSMYNTYVESWKMRKRHFERHSAPLPSTSCKSFCRFAFLILKKHSKALFILILQRKYAILTVRKTEVLRSGNSRVKIFFNGGQGRKHHQSGPVSYTHLDVYKRQARWSAWQRDCAFL